jgi:hypothetical protein
MTGLRRVGAAQVARRINVAVALLSAGLDVVGAARQLAARYGLSERHARRYVEQAAAGGVRKIPAAKVGFTVKLPKGLVRQVRGYGKRRHQTISAVVEQALQEFLMRSRAVGRGGGGGAASGSRARL